MTVTVSVPHRGDDDHLRTCVRSLLSQTYRDMRILIIGDGQRPRISTRDSRVDLYVLPENRGSYYARAVALAATVTSHHAIVDSDDWVDRDWLETLMRTGITAVQHGSRYVEQAGQVTVARQWRGARQPASSQLRHYTSHTGVYTTARLREAGGYSPAYRIGYDSLLAAVVRMQGPVAVVDRPLYHRRVHTSSLSMTPSTKIGSPERLKVREELSSAYRRVWGQRRDPVAVRTILHALTPQYLWDEIAAHADKIRSS